MREETSRITRDQIVYSLDGGHPPVLEIDPDTTLIFETFDARTGTIQRDSDLLDHPHPVGSNPATGPVLVRGAEPGDGLCVDILDIHLGQSMLNIPFNAGIAQKILIGLSGHGKARRHGNASLGHLTKAGILAPYSW